MQSDKQLAKAMGHWWGWESVLPHTIRMGAHDWVIVAISVNLKLALVSARVGILLGNYGPIKVTSITHQSYRGVRSNNRGSKLPAITAFGQSNVIICRTCWPSRPFFLLVTDVNVVHQVTKPFKRGFVTNRPIENCSLHFARFFYQLLLYRYHWSDSNSSSHNDNDGMVREALFGGCSNVTLDPDEQFLNLRFLWVWILGLQIHYFHNVMDFCHPIMCRGKVKFNEVFVRRSCHSKGYGAQLS